MSKPDPYRTITRHPSFLTRSPANQVIVDSLPLTQLGILNALTLCVTYQLATHTYPTLKNSHYLTSGVLESYLLGLASNEQKEELDRVLTTDPDVLAELNELEGQIEQYLLDNGVPPPPGLKVAIEQRINGTEIQKHEADTRSRFDPPTSEPQPSKSGYIDVEVSDTHIRVHKNWRTAFIAVFILAKVFLILGLYYYFRSGVQADEIMRLKTDAEQTAPLPRSTTP